MTAQGTVLVTAATLAPEAVAILEQGGFAVRCTQNYPDEAQLVERIRAERPVAVLHRHGVISAAVMDAGLPGLRVLARHGAGMDGIDVDAARARGLAVTRAAGANSRSVAEHAMALMLAALKDLPEVQRGMADGAWEKTSRMTRDIEGLTLAVVGHGAIGSKVARMAAAFGMRVRAFDPLLPAGPLAGPAERADTLHDALRGAEVLSLHCPLDATTSGMVGAAELALLAPGAVLVHTARGGIVEEGAILAALASCQLAWAGLDVFATEPLGQDSPLRRHPRVIATPHLAANTPRGAVAMSTGAAESIVAMLAGREPALPGAVVVAPAAALAA